MHVRNSAQLLMYETGNPSYSLTYVFFFFFFCSEARFLGDNQVILCYVILQSVEPLFGLMYLYH